MRTISPYAQQQIQNTGQDVVWVLSIHWPDELVHYAHRAINLSGSALPATLIDSGSLNAAVSSSPGPAHRRNRSHLKISLALDGAESPNLRQRIAATEPEGLEVEWSILFLDETGSASLSDAIKMFFGVISHVAIHSSKLEITCLDWISARGNKRFGRKLSKDYLPETGLPTEGRMLPCVFGAPGQVELLPWRIGHEVCISADVFPGDIAIPLESIDNLPEAGQIQLGDEIIVYESIDHENKTLGHAFAPLLRMEPAWHPAGTPARLIPPEGFEWFVADHTCKSVSNVMADEIPMQDEDYSVTTEEWEGKTIQKISFPRWPILINYSSSLKRFVFTSQTSESLWSVLPGNTALHPELATDKAGEETASELNAQAKILRLQFRQMLSGGLRSYGNLISMRFRVRLAADKLWLPGTMLDISYLCDSMSARTQFSRPLPEALSTSVPSHRHEDGQTINAELAVPFAYGPMDVYLDITDTVIANGGWQAFASPAAQTMELLVELQTENDPARFFISDIELEVSFQQRSKIRFADAFTASVEGLEIDSLFLENPADLVQYFLCSPEGMNLPLENIDTASFAAAATRLNDLGFRFSNRLSTCQSTESILARLLHESRCRLECSGNQYRLLPSNESLLNGSNLVFDSQTILQPDTIRLQRDDNAQLIRSVSLHHGRDFASRSIAASWRRFLCRRNLALRSVWAYSGHEYVDRLHWHNHGQPEPVMDLAESLLSEFGFRRQKLALKTPFIALPLETRDCISVNADLLSLHLNQGEVEAISVVEPHCLTVHSRFSVEGETIWRFDDANFLRQKGSGSFLEVWICGELVALFQWEGFLRIKGHVIEQASLASIPDSAICFDLQQEAICFSTSDLDRFTPRFSINREGDLHIAGTLTEKHLRDDIVLPQWNSANPDYIALGIAETMPIVVFDVAEQSLQCRGSIIENQKLY